MREDGPAFTAYTPSELRDLYDKDPTTFNTLAAEAIKQACVGRTSAQTLKLRQTQWLIDAQLRKAKTPLGKLHVMENIFYDRVYGENGLLGQLTSAWDDFLTAVQGADRVSRKKPELRLMKNS